MRFSEHLDENTVNSTSTLDKTQRRNDCVIQHLIWQCQSTDGAVPQIKIISIYTREYTCIGELKLKYNK